MYDRASQRSAVWGGDSTLQASPFPPRRRYGRLCCALHPDSIFRIQEIDQAMKKTRVTKEAVLSFLLTHLIVERGITLELDQAGLFSLSNLAQRAVEHISETEGMIPHELIEELAAEYLDSQ